MKIILAIIVAAFALVSCSNTPKKDTVEVLENTVSVEGLKAEGLELLQQKCYACHSVTTKSHDDIIAPPMIAVKKRYMMAYTDKQQFVEAFTNWALNPVAENALMFGAVDSFKVMPKQDFKKEEIEKIANYVYDNDIEVPEWFGAHFNEQHPNGMGNGNGNGMRNRMGKGNGSSKGRTNL